MNKILSYIPKGLFSLSAACFLTSLTYHLNYSDKDIKIKFISQDEINCKKLKENYKHEIETLKEKSKYSQNNIANEILYKNINELYDKLANVKC